MRTESATRDRCDTELKFSSMDGGYGLTTCSRPFSFFIFNKLAVPFASNTTYVSFVPDGPARLNPAASSDVLILTDGRPRSVISRSNTVSGERSP